MTGGGDSLIKPANLYMCTQKHYKHKDGCTGLGMHGHGSVPSHKQLLDRAKCKLLSNSTLFYNDEIRGLGCLVISTHDCGLG